MKKGNFIIRIRQNRFLKRILILAIFLSLLIVTAVYALDAKTITSKEDLNHEEFLVGVGEGSSSALIAEKELPEATLVYVGQTDGYQLVAQGKLDAYVYERVQMELAVESGRTGVKLLDENMDEKVHIAVGISPVGRIEGLEDKLNAFITELKEDGTLDEMYDRWMIKKDETFPDIELPENPKIHLTVGTTGIVPPFSYYKDSKLNGYDIELAYRFAIWLDADLKFKVYDYGGIIPAAQSGDVDCIMADLNVTKERAEALTFSQDLFEEEVGIMVRDASLLGYSTEEEEASLWDSVQKSFEKNFISEDRYKMFGRGFLTTFLITVLSILFGTLLGFFIFIMCKGGNQVANVITKLSMWLIRGMPMVVLLMILYYIIFGNVNISGVTVSVIAFTLTFGSAVFGLLKMGVGAVDAGQYEAAYALGYSVNRTFFKIILPQALPHVADAYGGEITGLIKATSIVGYIAVQDLTKVGDIVRSRTYEAFFPLMSIAVIYFMLEGLFDLLLKLLRICMDSKKRKRADILKGVKVEKQE